MGKATKDATLGVSDVIAWIVFARAYRLFTGHSNAAIVPVREVGYRRRSIRGRYGRRNPTGLHEGHAAFFLS